MSLFLIVFYQHIYIIMLIIQRSHSTNITITKNYIDIAWIQYLKDVYGSNLTTFISKNEINMYYPNSRTKIITLDWPIHYELLLPKGNEYRVGYLNKHKAPDYSWVEVERFRTDYNEGKSTGLPGMTGLDKVPYGCWFHAAKGSGVFVNIRRSLKLPSKEYSSFKELTLYGCLQSDRENICKDKYLCTAALSRGYDSIQIIDNNELIICYDKCARKGYKSNCPPIELRGGYNATKECKCNNNAIMMNCGYTTKETKNMYNTIIIHNETSPTLCIARKDKSNVWQTKTFQLKLFIFKSEHHVVLTTNDQVSDLKSNNFSYKILAINAFDVIHDYIIASEVGNVDDFHRKTINIDNLRFKYDIKFENLLIKSFYLDIINSKSTVLSIIRYYFNPLTDLISTVTRKIIDASNCLRTAGISLIILLSGNLHPEKPIDINIQRNISYLTEEFIDISLIINHTDHNSSNSRGYNTDKALYLNQNNNIYNDASYNKINNLRTILDDNENNSTIIHTMINVWSIDKNMHRLLDIISINKDKNIISIEKELLSFNQLTNDKG